MNAEKLTIVINLLGCSASFPGLYKVQDLPPTAKRGRTLAIWDADDNDILRFEYSDMFGEQRGGLTFDKKRIYLSKPRDGEAPGKVILIWYKEETAPKESKPETAPEPVTKSFIVLGKEPGDGGVYRAVTKAEALAKHLTEDSDDVPEEVMVTALLSEFPEVDKTGRAGDYEVKELTPEVHG